MSLLTVREVAERLQCSPATVYQLCAAKLLQHTRVGLGRGVIRIPEEAVTAYLERQTVEPNTAPPTPVRSRPLKHLRHD